MTKCLQFTEEEIHNALANMKHGSKNLMNSLTELENSYARTMIKSMASQKPQESCEDEDQKWINATMWRNFRDKILKP